LTIPHLHGTNIHMDEPKTDNGSQPIVLAQEPANPELASIKQFLILLDKTAKSRRTYGATNSVAQNSFSSNSKSSRIIWAITPN